MKEMTYISVVTYVHNDEDYILEYICRMDKFLNKNFTFYDIILVNNCSNDDTEKKILSVKDSIKGTVVIVDLAWKHNKEAAMLAGTDFCIGDFIYEIESVIIDYPLKLIKQMYQKSLDGYDIVSASSQKRRTFKKLFFRSIKLFRKLDYEYEEGKLRLISRRALNQALNNREKLRDRRIIYKYTGYPSTDIKYRSDIKHINKRNERFYDILERGVQVTLTYSNITSKLPSIFAYVCLGVAVLAIFLKNNLLESMKSNDILWMILIVVTLGFSGVLFSIALIGKSIKILLDEQKNKKLYSVSDIKRINKY